MKRRGMALSLADHPVRQIASLERRLFLGRGLSLGALAMLSGCSITDGEGVQKVLSAMSRWNDGVQSWLFDPNKLAPEYPESAITAPFPFNAYYAEDEVRLVDAASYRLELAGLVREKKPWTLPELYALPQTTQITRHICVEGWSAIGKWSGRPLLDLPRADRRRHHREVRRLQVRRRLLLEHRHGDGAAPADAAHASATAATSCRRSTASR